MSKTWIPRERNSTECRGCIVNQNLLKWTSFWTVRSASFFGKHLISLEIILFTVNSWIYPMELGDKFRLVLATTLQEDGRPGNY